MRKPYKCIIVIIVGLFLLSAGKASYAQEPIDVAYISVSGADLDSLASGGVGEGYLLYFDVNRGENEPALVVRLSRQSETSQALAEVYDTPPGAAHVPIEFLDSYPALPDSLTPTIVLTALDGWWVRDGIVNYNLDITVYGRAYAMWGADNTLWTQLLQPTDPNAHIMVRDTDRDGIPDWDWRTMLPEYHDRGDIRTHYVERKCDSAVTVSYGISPAWPYIASGGRFEQVTGEFRPPIVVDWETGRIRYFSEMVTARNQNCSYTLYSISRIVHGQLNSPNFESPFGFYDLSGEGVGYPNLIIRSGRVIRNDPLLSGKNPESQNIRYSWRNTVGDWRWDYKVDVLGRYEYDFETSIAGGAAIIDVPSYETFPPWLVSHEWPAVSFVGMEGRPYLSSEGIYEWSMQGAGDGFVYGTRDEPDLGGFNDIAIGMRGEYRLRSVHLLETYLSPIDNRLHLKWAEQGVWRIDDNHIIRLTNLNQDGYIDAWLREVKAATVGALGMPLEKQGEDSELYIEPRLLEALYAFDGYILHIDNDAVTLVATEYQPARLETLPPTDHDTWEVHRALLAPYEDQRRDPTDLRSWLDAFSGPRSEIAGASVANVRITDDGFRFELALEPVMQIAGADLLGLGDLPAGQYVVENRGGVFHVAPMAPAQLAIDVQPPAVNGVTQITVGNSGTADATNLELIVEIVAGDKVVVELSREPVDARAGEMARQLVTIPSNIRAGYYLSARLEDSAGETVVVSRPLSLAGPAAEHAGEFTLSRIPVLIPVLGSFSVLLALAALLAVMRRGRQFDI